MTNRRIYWIVGGIFAVLLVLMLVGWGYNRSNAAADQKAQQLMAAYGAAGLPVPADTGQIARVLGDDGGAVCDFAGSDIQTGYLKTRLGVGGEFYYRPTRVDRRMLRGLLLVVKVYCPDKLPAVEKLNGDLRYSNVVGD
jgi:hypothetical protein